MASAAPPAPPFVFFDVDDTLIQWTTSWADVFAQVAGEAGVEVRAEAVEQALTGGLDGLYQDCLRRHSARGDARQFWLDYDGQILASLGVKHDLDRHTERLLALFQRPGAIRLYPEVPEVLAQLKAAGVRLGIVTGRPVASPDLERLGVRHYFEPVIDALAAASSKREGRMFLLAAEAAAREGRAAWHVGDSYHDDVCGARAAGLRPILVDRRQQYREADCPRIGDLRALPDIILAAPPTLESNLTLGSEA